MRVDWIVNLIADEKIIGILIGQKDGPINLIGGVSTSAYMADPSILEEFLGLAERHIYRMLKLHGYEVLDYPSISEQFNKIRADAQAVDKIYTDERMKES